jgi:hypothetical protein
VGGTLLAAKNEVVQIKTKERATNFKLAISSLGRPALIKAMSK